MREFKPGIYRHFKGKLYLALLVATDCEDIEKKNVIYISLYENETSSVWSRELSNFLGMKTLEDGTEVERFKFIKER